MKTVVNPPRSTWKSLCERPVFDTSALTPQVMEVLNAVKNRGDAALRELTLRFDGCVLHGFEVAQDEKERAYAQIDPALADAIALAAQNIARFHQTQNNPETAVETMPGVKCWRENRPIERVGLYIPGGSAPLFSTLLMLGVPAKLAGCPEIVLATPPRRDGSVDPTVLYAASVIGIGTVYKIGGAQAIAALAYGTESIQPVYKIFGPGNQYVTRAKELVQLDGVAIDLPAGPSEVLVIADATCNPSFVAADLLSQAEHGSDSQVVLVTTDQTIADAVLAEVAAQLEALPRRDTAASALENSRVVSFSTVDDALDFSNAYAPEHLILASEQADAWLSRIVNAGSVFVGNYSCESAGDYASGTNHTLPTNGLARAYSGVSLDSFVKKITFQKLSREGLVAIGPAIERMAEAEQLIAHRNAVTLRLNALNDV